MYFPKSHADVAAANSDLESECPVWAGCRPYWITIMASKPLTVLLTVIHFLSLFNFRWANEHDV
jgi:hypothetical protein